MGTAWVDDERDRDLRVAVDGVRVASRSTRLRASASSCRTAVISCLVSSSSLSMRSILASVSSQRRLASAMYFSMAWVIPVTIAGAIWDTSMRTMCSMGWVHTGRN